MTGSLIVLTATALVTSMLMQDLPIPQQWTVLGLLGFVLVCGYLLVRYQGTNLAASIQGQTSMLGEHTKAIIDVAAKIQMLVDQNRDHKLEDDRRHEAQIRDRDLKLAEIERLLREALNKP